MKFEVEQTRKAEAQTARENAVRASVEQQRSAYFEKAASFIKTHPDFDEVLQAVSKVTNLPPVVEDVILASEIGPQLIYELAKNHDEAKRIAALPAIKAAVELGKLEAKLMKTAPPQNQSRNKTSAPAPISPVGAKNSPTAKKSLSDPSLTQAEYEQLRREQSQKRA